MLKKVISDESGRIIVWTLVALALGALLVPPFMTRISAGFIATRAVEEAMREQYAADAGVEYALYRIANDDYPEGPFGIPTAVNGMTITVTVEKAGIYHMITSTAGGTVVGLDVEYAPAGNRDIYNGALVSETDIRLGPNCIVDGNIRIGEGYTLTHSYPITHTGGSVIEQEIAFPLSNDFVEKYRAEALATDNTHEGNLIIASDSQTYLGPMLITGDLEVRMRSVITLTGTIFVEGIAGHMSSYDIKSQKDSVFTGDGSLVAQGDIYIQKASGFGTSGDAVIMSITGGIDFDKAEEVHALIYAPEGRIYFDKESSVTGGVVANYIYAKQLEMFVYDASFYDGFKLPGYQEARFKVVTYDVEP